MARRTALVTGGAAGIGAEIVRTLIADGFHVVSLDRNPAESSDPCRTDLVCDLFDPVATARVAAEIASRFRVTHFVHNAGVILPNLLETTSAADLVALAQLHLGAAITLVQALLPAMKEQGGRIVLMSSRAALGAVTRTVYAATKAGVIGLVRTWALELAQHGITVNAVAPGPIGGTEMFHAIVPAGDPRVAALAASIPVKRLGAPADVANAVRFLLADASGFITGQTINVCGGASIGQMAL